MPNLPTRSKKVIVYAVTAVGASVFFLGFILNMYWPSARRVPVPALGQVVEMHDKGHTKYYLTETESRLVSEPAMVSAILLLFVAGYLGREWDVFKR